jgi:uncharacterized protein YfdQ (DUF2303 family)
MDHTAIKRIEELAAANSCDLTEQHIPAIVTPSGCDIKSLEHLMERPAHQRVHYTTERLEDFCVYVKEESLSEGNTAVFVAPDGSGAEGIIDFGMHDTPLWGHHKAALAMHHSPEYAGLLAACARDLDQRALVDWLEDWSHTVQPLMNDETALSIPQAIQMIRKVDLKATANKTSDIGNFAEGRSTMEQIEAKCGDGAPPAVFGVTCQPYPHTRTRTIRARLSLKTSAGAPMFRLRIIGKEALEKEIAEEVELEIKTRLDGSDVRLFVGSVTKKG